MTADGRQNGDFRFADFEVDVAAQELYKGGIKIHLEVQPFQVLLKLLERPGEVVTREELKQNLWADDTFVDFDNGVNQAISKIRRALGDSAVRPRFVETLPRRGYRFVGRIDSPEPVQAAPRPPPPKPRRWIGYAAAALAGVLAGVFLYQFAVGPASPPPALLERRFPPFVVPDLDFFWARDGLVEVSPDASRVAYIAGGRIGVWDLNEVAKDRRLDGTEGAGQLAWAPDGEFIAFRTRTALKLVAARGAPPITLWEGGPFHINSGIISWNTDRTILFNHEDAPLNREATSAVSTFEISRDGGIPHPVDAPPKTFGFAPRFLSTARSAFLYQTGFYAFQHQIMLRNAGSEDTQVLGPGWNPWYSPSGHIVFESLRPPAGIWAMPFAAGNATAEEPFPIAE